ncbi:MAG: hypothetical protein GXO76_12030 [Calditrichaeota bacterium]|nr:hypothetical protein [Calditrichota bacterium]
MAKKTPKTNEWLLQEMEGLLEQLSIPVRYERGSFKGGLCRLNNDQIFIINKNLPLEQKLQIFREELERIDLEDIFIRPVLRNYLRK